MPGSSSWMPCAPQRVTGLDDNDDDDDDDDMIADTEISNSDDIGVVLKDGC